MQPTTKQADTPKCICTVSVIMTATYIGIYKYFVVYVGGGDLQQ